MNTVTYVLSALICVLCVLSQKHSFSLNQMSRYKSALKKSMGHVQHKKERKEKKDRNGHCRFSGCERAFSEKLAV